MAVQSKTESVRSIHLFQGLTDSELTMVADLCEEQSFGVGEICQTEGQATDRVTMILQGRVGTVVRIPTITYLNSEIILAVLHGGDVFGWSSLIKSTPWSTLRTLDPVEVLQIKSESLLDLCDKNGHLGFIIMRNLSSLIASRLRRNRASMLNMIVAIKG